jgi:ubiquinone/menaquinone biosynthesis C-methylase UbiE
MTREITKGKVVGVDPSEGMIREAIEKSMGLDITFEVKSAEEIEYKSCLDVIFCNSSLQWFREPQKAVKNCYIALRKGGRIGIQAPAKRVYSPNFIGAVEKVKEDQEQKIFLLTLMSLGFCLKKKMDIRICLRK